MQRVRVHIVTMREAWLAPGSANAGRGTQRQAAWAAVRDGAAGEPPALGVPWLAAGAATV